MPAVLGQHGSTTLGLGQPLGQLGTGLLGSAGLWEEEWLQHGEVRDTSAGSSGGSA